MVKTFEAEEKSIRDIFQEKLSYDIPSYQRPYSWGKDEIEKFCEDILLSYENGDEYLLSSIILVELKKNKKYEVIDGQQRLTTISIFLSVLKLFLKNKEAIDDLNSRILNGGELRVQRVRTDRSYYTDFQKVLESFNYEEFKELVKKREFKKNKYYINAIYIYEFFKDLESKNFNFDDFYEDYFIDEVYLIKVQTTEQNKAMRLFEVLNSRGMPLENSDLIKNHIMENIYENYDEDDKILAIEGFESKWKEISRNLDEYNESIEDLFTYYVYMKLKENPKRNLFEEFKLILKNNFQNGDKIDKFLKDFNHFYDTFIELFKDTTDIENYRKINSMTYLREGRFWKTILVSYKINYPEGNFKKLVDMVFRFYYLNLLSGESVNPYKQTSFNTIKAIVEKKFEFENLNEKYEEYFVKRNTFANIKQTLSSDAYGERWVKPLLYLIEYFYYKEKEDDEIFNLKNNKIQIEHIFPKSTKFWTAEVNSDPEMHDLLNDFGNLTLLYQSSNVKCSDFSFEKKLEIYSNSHKFRYSQEISKKYDVWNSSKIKKRKQDIFKKLSKLFDIEL